MLQKKITILKAWKIMKKNMFHLSPAIECEVVMQRREDKHEIIMLGLRGSFSWAPARTESAGESGEKTLLQFVLKSMEE